MSAKGCQVRTYALVTELETRGAGKGCEVEANVSRRKSFWREFDRWSRQCFLLAPRSIREDLGPLRRKGAALQKLGLGCRYISWYLSCDIL